MGCPRTPADRSRAADFAYPPVGDDRLQLKIKSPQVSADQTRTRESPLPSIDRTLCLARGVFAALCALALTACVEDVVWPISKSGDLDADEISSPYGPRDQSGNHDFHAGVDFRVPEGTKVRAIKAGTVQSRSSLETRRTRFIRVRSREIPPESAAT